MRRKEFLVIGAGALIFPAEALGDKVDVSISITDPDGMNLNGVVGTTVTASPTTNLTQIELYIDDILVKSVSSSPLTYDWNTVNSANGTHVLRGEAVYKRRRSKTQIAVTVNNSVSPPPPPPPSDLGSALPARMPESTGAIFYVSTSGSDSNPGTQAQPWRTVTKAANTLTSGQKALVAAGVYAENVIIRRDMRGPEPATIEALDPANRPVISYFRFEQSNGVPGAYWRIRNVVIDGSTGQQDGVKIQGGSSQTPPHHIEFYGVEIRDIGRNQWEMPQAVSIQGSIGNIAPHHLHFYNCEAHHVRGTNSALTHNFYAGQAEAVVFANCIARDSTGLGFRIGSSSSGDQGVRHSYFVNNTVVRSSEKGGYSIFADGSNIPPNYLDAGNFVCNNIVAYCGRGYESRYYQSGPADEMNTFDRNIYWQPGGGSSYQNGFDPYTSSVFVSLPVVVDPLFANPTGNDFHLRSGSPAIGAGLPAYTPAFDFDGNPRATADLGAFRA